MTNPYKLNWKGKRLLEILDRNIPGLMTDIGLTAEGFSKLELYKGHGVLTGTLRRSIHTASPSHNFSGDSASSDLGGQAPSPEKVGGRWSVAVGSGLSYALPVHQGHGSFRGYHYLTNGVNKTKAKIPNLVTKWSFK